MIAAAYEATGDGIPPWPVAVTFLLVAAALVLLGVVAAAWIAEHRTPRPHPPIRSARCHVRPVPAPYDQDAELLPGTRRALTRAREDVR